MGDDMHLKISAPQKLALERLSIAEEMQGNADYWQWEGVPGWYQRSKFSMVRKVSLVSLLHYGLIEEHPYWHVYRMSVKGIRWLQENKP